MSNSGPRMRVSLNEDQSGAVLEFLPSSGLGGCLKLDRGQLLNLITELGRAHALLTTGESVPSIIGVEAPTVADTSWFFERQLASDGTLMFFYHSWFGPVGFLIPHSQVMEMVKLLSSYSQIPALAPGSKAN